MGTLTLDKIEKLSARDLRRASEAAGIALGDALHTGDATTEREMVAILVRLDGHPPGESTRRTLREEAASRAEKLAAILAEKTAKREAAATLEGKHGPELLGACQKLGSDLDALLEQFSLCKRLAGDFSATLQIVERTDWSGINYALEAGFNEQLQDAGLRPGLRNRPGAGPTAAGMAEDWINQMLRRVRVVIGDLK